MVEMISIFWKILRISPKKSLEFLMRSLTPICVYDEQGQLVYASQKFLKLIQADAKKNNFFDCFQSGSRPLATLTEDWELALQAQPVQFLSKIKDTSKQIECSLQFDPSAKLMFLMVKPASHDASICQLTEEYERLILSLFNHPSFATALISLEGMIIKGNQRLYELLGAKENEILQIEEFIHPADKLIDTDLRENLLDGAIDSYTIEKRLIDRNHEIIWIDLSVSLINMPIQTDQHKKYFVVLFEDITENKKIYNALVRTEGKWKTFILNSLNLFIQTSSTGQIIYTSPGVERILGYESEELLDLYISEFVHPNDLSEFELALRLWSSGNQSSELGIECRWKAKSGLWVCLYIQGRRFPLSLEIDGLIIDGYDITDRKFLEAELRASEAKFRFLALNISGAVFQSTLDYTMRFVGNEIQKITGYSAVEFLHNRLRPYISIIHPEDVELVKNSMIRSRFDHYSNSIEYRIIHANGSVRWVSECRQAIFAANGKISGFDGIVFDISEAKRNGVICKEEDLHCNEAMKRALV
jgi:PAS domain S-box-containing protein